jgi:hypothetical protein
MVHGRGESDPGVVARKPANKAERPAAAQSAAEPRAGTEGNASQQSRRQTQGW